MSVPPPPIPLSPLLRDQRAVDAGHLRLLAVFHGVAAALGVVGLLMLFGHYMLMNTMFNDPEFWSRTGPNQPNFPPPQKMFEVFKWLYVFLAMAIVACSIMNLIAAFAIRDRKWRVFTLINAGLNCMGIPLGTILGIFTFIVLLRPSVEEVYAARAAGSAPGGGQLDG